MSHYNYAELVRITNERFDLLAASRNESERALIEDARAASLDLIRQYEINNLPVR